MIDSGLLYLKGFFIEIDVFLLITFLVIAAIYDIKSRRIPNWLVLCGIVTSFIYQAFSGYGYGVNYWAIGLAVGFFSFFPLYILRAMGAGDVKLMALVGSFLGGIAAIQTVLLTLITGGVLALLIMLWNRSWKLVFQNIGMMSANLTIAVMTRQLPKAEAPAKSAGTLPYGVAIAGGTLFYIFVFRP